MDKINGQFAKYRVARSDVIHNNISSTATGSLITASSAYAAYHLVLWKVETTSYVGDIQFTGRATAADSRRNMHYYTQAGDPATASAATITYSSAESSTKYYLQVEGVADGACVATITSGNVTVTAMGFADPVFTTDETGTNLQVDGTAALPAYSFSLDTDTGVYRIGADSIGVSTGGLILTIDADDVEISDAHGLLVGSATQVTISDGDGATNLIPEVQVLGTAAADSSVLVAAFNTANTRITAPRLALVKGGAATQVATTALADDEVVGTIIAYGSDGVDFETPVGSIEFVVDDSGGPGAGAIGGSIEFYTTADGGETLTKRVTIGTDGAIAVANGTPKLTMGTVSAFGTTQPTNAIVFREGTAAAGTITTATGLFASATVLRKIIADGTVSNVET